MEKCYVIASRLMPPMQFVRDGSLPGAIRWTYDRGAAAEFDSYEDGHRAVAAFDAAGEPMLYVEVLQDRRRQ
jgi:hypothetical protein